MFPCRREATKLTYAELFSTLRRSACTLLGCRSLITERVLMSPSIPVGPPRLSLLVAPLASAYTRTTANTTNASMVNVEQVISLLALAREKYRTDKSPCASLGLCMFPQTRSQTPSGGFQATESALWTTVRGQLVLINMLFQTKGQLCPIFRRAWNCVLISGKCFST